MSGPTYHEAALVVATLEDTASKMRLSGRDFDPSMKDALATAYRVLARAAGEPPEVKAPGLDEMPLPPGWSINSLPQGASGSSDPDAWRRVETHGLATQAEILARTVARLWKEEGWRGFNAAGLLYGASNSPELGDIVRGLLGFSHIRHPDDAPALDAQLRKLAPRMTGAWRLEVNEDGWFKIVDVFGVAPVPAETPDAEVMVAVDPEIRTEVTTMRLTTRRNVNDPSGSAENHRLVREHIVKMIHMLEGEWSFVEEDDHTILLSRKRTIYDDERDFTLGAVDERTAVAKSLDGMFK